VTIGTNSFSSVEQVAVYTQHLLEGSASFSTSTHPTLAQVESFIDQVSGMLISSLAKYGFSVANIQANTYANLACDMWVSQRVAQMVEFTSPIASQGTEEERSKSLWYFVKSSDEFVKQNAEGWKNLGITTTTNLSSGLSYTGLTKQADRVIDDTQEQPVIKRHQFDNGSSEDEA